MKKCAIVGNSVFVHEVEKIAKLLGYDACDTYTEEDFATLVEKRKVYENIALCSQDPRMNLSFYRELSALGAPLAPMIHPTAMIAESAVIGDATIVGMSVQVQEHSRVGVCCVLERSVILDRNCVLDDGVFIDAHTGISEGVKIGEYAWLGRGALVMSRRVIGKNASVGVGAFVMEDLADDEYLEGEGSYSGMISGCECCL